MVDSEDAVMIWIQAKFTFNSLDRMPTSKLITLLEAIERCVPDGASVALGLCLEAMIPFAAGHEIIRRRRHGLTLVGPISDMLFDQLIGAGCVRRVQAAWVGNVITGSGYNFRRGVESGNLTVEDHSNLSMAAALKAGAWGVPFLPVRTALGSDLFATNAGLDRVTCPFSGERLGAVAAIRPDVAIIHVQRSDAFGNAHAWGNLGVAPDACLAAETVILTAEEIVTADVITSDPNRVITPGFRVRAVAHVPWGGHPSPVPGFYNRDHHAFINYRDESRSTEGFSRWRHHWVDPVETPQDYMNLIGRERMQALKLHHHLYSEPVDYGY